MKNLTLMDYFYLLLLCLAVFGLVLDWNIGHFSFSKIYIHWYFHFWVALAIFLLSIALSFYFYYLFRRTNLSAFAPLPVAFFLYAFGVIIMGLYDSYCKTCSDLGICSSAHNYPNMIALLILFVVYLCYLLYEDRVQDKIKQDVLRFLLYLNLVITFLMIIIVFIGLFFMKLPSDLYYRKLLNWQGLVFVSIGLYSFLVAKESLRIHNKK